MHTKYHSTEVSKYSDAVSCIRSNLQMYGFADSPHFIFSIHTIKAVGASNDEVATERQSFGNSYVQLASTVKKVLCWREHVRYMAGSGIFVQRKTCDKCRRWSVHVIFRACSLESTDNERWVISVRHGMTEMPASMRREWLFNTWRDDATAGETHSAGRAYILGQKNANYPKALFGWRGFRYTKDTVCQAKIRILFELTENMNYPSLN